MVASCDQQKSKLHAVADGLWVVELRVRQVKIGSKSCYGKPLCVSVPSNNLGLRDFERLFSD